MTNLISPKSHFGISESWRSLFSWLREATYIKATTTILGDFFGPQKKNPTWMRIKNIVSQIEENMKNTFYQTIFSVLYIFDAIFHIPMMKWRDLWNERKKNLDPKSIFQPDQRKGHFRWISVVVFGVDLFKKFRGHHMGVEPKIMGKLPQIIHFFIGLVFHEIKTIHFGGYTNPYFWKKKHPYIFCTNIQSDFFFLAFFCWYACFF